MLLTSYPDLLLVLPPSRNPRSNGVQHTQEMNRPQKMDYEKLLEPILKMKQKGRIPCYCPRVQGTCGWLCANIHPDYYKLPVEKQFDDDFLRDLK